MVVLMSSETWRAAAEGRALLKTFATAPWTRVAAVTAVVSLLSALAVSGAFAQAAERRVIRITAERFSFTPSEIVLDEGEEVELRFRSEDTSHGFRLDGTAIKIAIPKRGKGEVSVVFRAERAGRYTFECHRMCGAGHDFMRGAIEVRPRAAPPSGEAGHGR
jgi:cytochrome c oxidase subunit II